MSKDRTDRRTARASGVRGACPCSERTVPAEPRGLADLHRDESAATTLEWALLLAAIGLPSYFIIQLAIDTLVGHYQMMTMINSLPFP